MNENDSKQRRIFSPFVRRLFTWRRARRTLIGLACFATLIGLFYTEENWRGKRAWDRCKADLEARGVVMDWNAFIPPLVPDDQNIFKAANMQEWFVGRGSNRLSGLLQGGNAGSLLPRGPTRTEATNFLAWCQTVESTLNTIREALKRPYARMDGDYREAFNIPIPHFVNVRCMAQILAVRTRCHMMMEGPGQAVEDLAFMHDLNRLLDGQPTGKPMTLVAAMIKVAVCGLYADTISQGFKQNAWSEPELVGLASQLVDTDCLSQAAEAFRDERAAVSQTMEQTAPREIARQWLSFPRPRAKTNFWEILKTPMYAFRTFAPRGWIYQNLVVATRLGEPIMYACDPTNHLVLPTLVKQATRAIDQEARSHSPYSYLASVALPNYMRAIQTIALNQTKVNEAFLACALERYHLAHGEFPESLDALVPQFADKLPHDLIGGQPLHYRRTPDGKYLLYSVGWNETDDGGQLVLNSDGKPDLEKGDWVWQ